jgi:hypothetical protein
MRPPVHQLLRYVPLHDALLIDGENPTRVHDRDGPREVDLIDGKPVTKNAVSHRSLPILVITLRVTGT